MRRPHFDLSRGSSAHRWPQARNYRALRPAHLERKLPQRGIWVVTDSAATITFPRHKHLPHIAGSHLTNVVCFLMHFPNREDNR